jgi:hypothetical protein
MHHLPHHALSHHARLIAPDDRVAVDAGMRPSRVACRRWLAFALTAATFAGVQAAPAAAQQFHYQYGPGIDALTLPLDTTQVNVTAYGASGSAGGSSAYGFSGGAGGAGAAVNGGIPVSAGQPVARPGDTLLLMVPSVGSGGSGGTSTFPGVLGAGGAGGGAAVVTDFTLSQPLVVAGGGGGGGGAALSAGTSGVSGGSAPTPGCSLSDGGPGMSVFGSFFAAGGGGGGTGWCGGQGGAFGQGGAAGGSYITTLLGKTLQLLGSTGVSTAPAGAGVIALTVTTSGLAPTITSGSTVNASAGSPLTFDVTATGSPAPTYSLSGAPSWLSINTTTGVLSGAIPQGDLGDTITFSVDASNDDGTATEPFTVIVSTTGSHSCAAPTHQLCYFGSH